MYRVWRENILLVVRSFTMPFSIKPICSCAAVAWLFLCVLGSVGGDEKAPTDGTAVRALRIRLQLPAAEQGKQLPPQCAVTLENVGDSDLNVQLGFSLCGRQDVYGNGPLWRAAFDARGNYRLVEILIAAGADPNQKNKSDKSPIDFAVTIGDESLKTLLEKG
jgi:hypothetical protein